ncbi:cyclase family protein [Desulforhopalus singaporensis]|uniref:Kynurenine formamidase n=1 Tax=Desulforhopalus singaporensis TaxID=91360 RepID=A0A1H0RWX8_9BACT|nr:cyclase family protein [Desulforhopalus singaporensis]SDP33930.1 Kynurenine formamidase [Desulforhopalus singaporensis]
MTEEGIDTIAHSGMRGIDLTQAVSSTMSTYPGDPEVSIEKFLVHDRDGCHVNAIHMGSHTGTHIDAPFHFLKDGRTIDEYPVDRFLGSGVLVDVSGRKPEEPVVEDDLSDYLSIIEPGDFVIFRTGWDVFFNSSRYFTHPYLTPGVARLLLKLEVSLVGIDALSVDSTVGNSFSVHRILLGGDVLIVENICNLGAVPERRGFYLFLPLKLDSADGSPVRAVFLSRKGRLRSP